MSVDLSTTYLGLKLKNPLVASASPLTGKLDTLQRLEEAGAAAAVWPSLFEEQIEHEELEVARLYDSGSDSFAESSSFLPDLDDYRIGPEVYLSQIEEAKKKLTIPLIGSLNGCRTAAGVPGCRRSAHGDSRSRRRTGASLRSPCSRGAGVGALHRGRTPR